jgi:hypothetical protein
VSTVLPWELSPVLQQERLILLAQVVAGVRNKVFAEANRDEGDTNWGLACRAHERLGHALERLAADGQHPWLTVIRDGLYLMPLVDGVPVRPFRGPADRAPARHLDALRAEAERNRPKQTAFSFMDAADSEGPWFWLMAVETDVLGQVARVVYFQANDAGETRHPWECPLDAPPAEAAAEAPAEPAKRRRPKLRLVRDEGTLLAQATG